MQIILTDIQLRKPLNSRLWNSSNPISILSLRLITDQSISPRIQQEQPQASPDQVSQVMYFRANLLLSFSPVSSSESMNWPVIRIILTAWRFGSTALRMGTFSSGMRLWWMNKIQARASTRPFFPFAGRRPFARMPALDGWIVITVIRHTLVDKNRLNLKCISALHKEFYLQKHHEAG